jgi:succinate dehydrogenase/fumarate reductase cytochrome b subunit (b558 family)
MARCATRTPLSPEGTGELPVPATFVGAHAVPEKLDALPGLFLCFFLVIHLFGHLQLLLPAASARRQFNFYTKLLSENIFIALISYFLFASILTHAVHALLITRQNRWANGQGYAYDRRGVSSKWYSRNMGLLGTILLFFLVIYLRDFWYQLQFGHVPLDKDGQKDLYTLVVYRLSKRLVRADLCLVHGSALDTIYCTASLALPGRLAFITLDTCDGLGFLGGFIASASAPGLP